MSSENILDEDKFYEYSVKEKVKVDFEELILLFMKEISMAYFCIGVFVSANLIIEIIRYFIKEWITLNYFVYLCPLICLIVWYLVQPHWHNGIGMITLVFFSVGMQVVLMLNRLSANITILLFAIFLTLLVFVVWLIKTSMEKLNHLLYLKEKEMKTEIYKQLFDEKRNGVKDLKELERKEKLKEIESEEIKWMKTLEFSEDVIHEKLRNHKE